MNAEPVEHTWMDAQANATRHRRGVSFALPLGDGSRPGQRGRIPRAVGVGLLACAVGAAIPFVSQTRFVAALIAVVLVVAVIWRPQLAAYTLIAVTPLVAGIDRGVAIPVLRPNEALLLLVAVALVVRILAFAPTGSVRFPPVDRLTVSILLMAVATSVLPVAWMLLRHQQVQQDDILYALLPWKYLVLFLVTRMSVTTERQVRMCLWISMVSAAIVAVLAMCETLQILGVQGILSHYFTGYGASASATNLRGGSTLSLPIAVADLMTFNLAIAVGCLHFRIGPRGPLLALGSLFVAGVLAAGEFSGAIGLVLGVAVLAVVLRRIKPLFGFLPIFGLAALAMRPVIETRLSGFQSASGLPASWSGRWFNLTNYFWPTLFSKGNFILGVRPAARVVVPSQVTGYVWIESGYTWLLWGGGIPLLASFFWFLWVNIRNGLRLVRERADSVAVAGLAVVVGLSVVGVLMILDPHLTYRGSADLLFSLIGLTAVGGAARPSSRSAAPARTGWEAASYA
jgi:hypothetical protein